MKDFLETVVPSDGHICIAVHNGRFMRHKFFSDAASAAAFVAQHTASSDVYYSFASFEEPTKRRRTNAKSIQAFVFDVDTGKDGAYRTKNDALAAIHALVKHGSLLPPSIIVDSGGGYHLYWLLDTPCTVEEWLPRARVFKRKLISLDPVLAVDTVRVTDPVGLLRVPGTTNTKRQAPVDILLDAGDSRYSIDDFPADATVAVVEPESGKLSSIGAVPYDVHPRVSPDVLDADITSKVPAEALFKACPLFADAYACQETESYEAWWATIQLCAFTAEGETLAHFMSSRYQKYSAHETSEKFAQAVKSQREGVGPVTCDTYCAARGKSEICAKCAYKDIAKSPIVAANKAHEATVAKVRKSAVLAAQNPVVQDEPADMRQSADRVTAAPAPQVPKAIEEVAKQGVLADATFEFDSETGVVFAVMQSGKHVEHVVASPRAMTVLGRVDGEEPVAIIGVYNKPGTKIVRKVTVPAAHMSTVHALHKVFNAVGYAIPAGNDMAQRAYRLYASALSLQFNMAARVYSGASRMGWVNDGFILADKKLTAKGEEAIEPSPELQRVVSLFKTGGKREWHYKALERMLALLPPQMQLALLAALASPLLKFTGESGLFVHLEGPSGCGKSTLLRIASGLYGKPTSTHFTPNDTRASRESRLYLYRHLPALFDEVTPLLAEGEKLNAFVYSITNGEGYHRARRDGSLQKPKSGWNLIALTTANISMTGTFSKGGKLNNVDEALLMRVMELKISSAVETGKDPEAQTMLAALERNYGWVGRDFLWYVLKNTDAIKERVKGLMDSYNMQHGPRYRFINAGLVCAKVALEILNELGIRGVPMDLIDVIGNKLRSDAEETRKEMKRAKSPEAIFAQLVYYIREGMAVFTTPDKSTLENGEYSNGYVLQTKPRNRPIARLLLSPDGARLFVHASEMRKFCSSVLDVALRDVLDGFVQAGILIPGDGNAGETYFDLYSGIPDAMGNVAMESLMEPCYELVPPAQLAKR